MINIIGSGLAGLSAAIHLSKNNQKCRLISLQEAERAQSVMAEGGINAAMNTMGENDDVSAHYEDTLKGGAYLGDPNSIDNLTKNAPQIVEWLLSLGVPFQMEKGKLIQRNFGGQKNKRTAYVKSSTGKMLMSALIDEARKYEVKGFIERYDHHKVTEILIEDNRCTGLKVLDTYTGNTLKMNGPVILCYGGLTGFFEGKTTGSSDNSGQIAADLFTQGVKMANLEMIQYHPTTIRIPGKSLLVSEAARGEGARFMTYRNNEPYYFMEEMYPEEKNLVTRDVASRAVYRIMNDENCSGEVYLDMSHLDEKIFKEKLSDMREEILEHLNLDIAKTPFRIAPGIHYFMGGILVDENHRSNIEGLYAAGECACIYHGGNRLGGNSLLGAIYGGKRSSEFVEDYGDDKIETIIEENEECSPVINNQIIEILSEHLGIIRDEDSLNDALRKIDELENEKLNDTERNRVIFARAMILSALNRKESRGAHYRSDYPEADENYRKTAVATYDGQIHIDYEEIPLRREPC